MFDLFPADEYRLFEQPVGATLSVGSSWTPVVPADPTRVSILFSGDASHAIYLSPLGINLGVSGGQGITLTASSPILELLWSVSGPICQAGWQASTPAGGLLTTITVSLRRNPEMYGYSGLFKQPRAQPLSLSPLPARPPAIRAQRRPLPRGLLRRLQQRAPSVFGELD